MECIDIKGIVKKVNGSILMNFAKVEEKLSASDKKVFETSLKNFSENRVKALISPDEDEKLNYEYLASMSLAGIDVIMDEMESATIRAGLKAAFDILDILLKAGFAPEENE